MGLSAVPGLSCRPSTIIPSGFSPAKETCCEYGATKPPSPLTEKRGVCTRHGALDGPTGPSLLPAPHSVLLVPQQRLSTGARTQGQPSPCTRTPKRASFSSSSARVPGTGAQRLWCFSRPRTSAPSTHVSMPAIPQRERGQSSAPLPTPSQKFRGLPEFYTWRDYGIPPDVFSKPAREERRSPWSRAGPRSGNWPRMPVTPTQPPLSKPTWPRSRAWDSGPRGHSGGQTECLSTVPGRGRPRAERAAFWQCARQPLEPDTALRLGLAAHGEGRCSWPGGPRSQPGMPCPGEEAGTQRLSKGGGANGPHPGTAWESEGWRPRGADPPGTHKEGQGRKRAAEGAPASPSRSSLSTSPPRPARREESRPRRSGEAGAAGKTARGGGPGRALTCPRRP